MGGYQIKSSTKAGDPLRFCAETERKQSHRSGLAGPSVNLELSGHVHNYLVQNVLRALVDNRVVKCAGTTLQEKVGYDIYKIFEERYLSEDERQKRMLEGIQSVDLCKIRSNASDKKTSGVAAETKLSDFYGNTYCIRLDHQILTDHGVF